jgi:hypothetical protein
LPAPADDEEEDEPDEESREMADAIIKGLSEASKTMRIEIDGQLIDDKAIKSLVEELRNVLSVENV